jgi:hypothetical protein
MHRRELLTVTATALGTVSFAGCTGSSSTSDGSETPTPATRTEPGEGTPTQTPVPFSDTCQPLPDIDTLPARPTELTEESVRSYVTEFERAYAVATESRYGGIASLQLTETETIGDRYRLQLEVEAEPVTPTRAPDGRTPTPMPAGAYAHKVLYRLEGDRMMRELLTYPDEAPLSSDCWILSASET